MAFILKLLIYLEGKQTHLWIHIRTYQQMEKIWSFLHVRLTSKSAIRSIKGFQISTNNLVILWQLPTKADLPSAFKIHKLSILTYIRSRLKLTCQLLVTCPLRHCIQGPWSTIRKIRQTKMVRELAWLNRHFLVHLFCKRPLGMQIRDRDHIFLELTRA